MAKTAVRMTSEQVAAYAQQLQFGSASGTWCESLGETMLEACYETGPSSRVSHVIGRLNGRKGQCEGLDTLINAVIMQIEGKL